MVYVCETSLLYSSVKQPMIFSDDPQVVGRTAPQTESLVILTA